MEFRDLYSVIGGILVILLIVALATSGMMWVFEANIPNWLLRFCAVDFVIIALMVMFESN